MEFTKTYEGTWRHAVLYPVGRIFDFDDRELFDATVRHGVKQGGDVQMDYRVVWPDGSVHWVANRAQVHRDAVGRVRADCEREEPRRAA